jgi:hypothetical protein
MSGEWKIVDHRKIVRLTSTVLAEPGAQEKAVRQRMNLRTASNAASVP